MCCLEGEGFMSPTADSHQRELQMFLFIFIKCYSAFDLLFTFGLMLYFLSR